MIVTIHQPNFVPWYPFFQKIEQVDVFVVSVRSKVVYIKCTQRFRTYKRKEVR